MTSVGPDLSTAVITREMAFDLQVYLMKQVAARVLRSPARVFKPSIAHQRSCRSKAGFRTETGLVLRAQHGSAPGLRERTPVHMTAISQVHEVPAAASALFPRRRSTLQQGLPRHAPTWQSCIGKRTNHR